jgi:hypothetical protein
MDSLQPGYSPQSSPCYLGWEKCLGGAGAGEAGVKQTPDGGYVLAGGSRHCQCDTSNSSDIMYTDFGIVKLNSCGVKELQKCLGGTREDYARSIQPTTDGGYVVAGWINSIDGDVTDPRGTTTSAWVVKLDPSMKIVWQKCLGGSREDEAHSIQQTSDGGYITAGSTNSNDGDVNGWHASPASAYNAPDMWVVKLNPTGAIEWQKCLGGSSSDSAYSVMQTKDGGYIVAGRTSSQDGDVRGWHAGLASGTPASDFWVVKLNPTGAMEWQKCLGGSGTDFANSVYPTSDSGYIVAGSTNSNDGDVRGWHAGLASGSPASDFWVVKLNPTGAMEWQKCLGGSGTDSASSVQETKDGHYIVAGSTSSNDGNVSGNHGNLDFWLVKLSYSTGAVQWQACKGGSENDAANGIQQTDDGGYVAAGSTSSNNGCTSNNCAGNNAWVVKVPIDGVGVFKPSTGKFYLDNDLDSKSEKDVLFGKPGDIPFAGDWDGDGRDGIGVYRVSNRTLYLCNALNGKISTKQTYSLEGFYKQEVILPVAGDWDGDGKDGVGLYENRSHKFYLDNNLDGNIDKQVTFNLVRGQPIAGDWDGDGKTGVGLYVNSTHRFYLDNNLDGNADKVVNLMSGTAGDIPVSGKWSGDGKLGVGVYRPSNRMFYLDFNLDGKNDASMRSGKGNDLPVAGCWGG